MTKKDIGKGRVYPVSSLPDGTKFEFVSVPDEFRNMRVISTSTGMTTVAGERRTGNDSEGQPIFASVPAGFSISNSCQVYVRE